MPVTRTVRVTRTWDFEVEAEYGDTRESLAAKVTEEDLDGTAPDAEVRVVVEEHDSEFETREEMEAAAPPIVVDSEEPADTPQEG